MTLLRFHASPIANEVRLEMTAGFGSLRIFYDMTAAQALVLSGQLEVLAQPILERERTAEQAEAASHAVEGRR